VANSTFGQNVTKITSNYFCMLYGDAKAALAAGSGFGANRHLMIRAKQTEEIYTS